MKFGKEINMINWKTASIYIKKKDVSLFLILPLFPMFLSVIGFLEGKIYFKKQIRIWILCFKSFKEKNRIG